MQNFEIIIRNAELSDSEFIATLEKECFSHPWSRQLAEDEIYAENSVFLIAEFCDNSAGYISGRNVAGEFYINNIAVKKEYRKNGIASHLLKELIFRAENMKCEFITLEVRASNTAALSLYEKFGFDKVGERKNFYDTPTENAYIYTLYFK